MVKESTPTPLAMTFDAGPAAIRKSPFGEKDIT
jgi:hypothetical protein